MVYKQKMKTLARLLPILFFVLFFHTEIVYGAHSIKIRLTEHEDIPLPFLRTGQSFGKVDGLTTLNGRPFYGRLIIIDGEDGPVAINELLLEKYVEGVVASEMGEDWPLEALKAQAVLSRTYAFQKKMMNKSKPYHLIASTFHQVYAINTPGPTIQSAVRETEGQILTFKGNPIIAFYHSTTGGKTELPEEVWQTKFPYYAKSRVCEDLISPYFVWYREFYLKDIGSALGLTDIKGITLHSYTATGRVKAVNVLTEGRVHIVLAKQLREKLGFKALPSTNFTLDHQGDQLIFQGQGYGHGVGLSQYGARQMAIDGKTYKEILSYFYPGTVIAQPP
jgi:stage II sporulation protein D